MERPDETTLALVPFVECVAERITAEKVRNGIVPWTVTRREILEGIGRHVGLAMRELHIRGTWKGHQTLNDISIEKA